MGITKQELVDIISSQVQTVVMEKVQAFTDGWASEFHKLVVEVKGTEEHNSLIIGKLNDHEAMFGRLRDTTDKVSKLFTMFYENGFSGRFVELQKAFQAFLTTRAETCPLNRRRLQWTPIALSSVSVLVALVALFLRLKPV